MTFVSSEKSDYFLSRNCATEQWLKDEVAAALDALKADSLRAVGADHVRQRLTSEHAKICKLRVG